MSKNPNVEKAAQALAIMPPAVGVNSYFGDIADTLDRCGLLVTPLHQRALEACKAYFEYMQLHQREAEVFPVQDVFVVGREALALEKPKERWVALCLDGVWRVSDELNSERLYKCGDKKPGWFTEAQARAIATALNEVSE